MPFLIPPHKKLATCFYPPNVLQMKRAAPGPIAGDHKRPKKEDEEQDEKEDKTYAISLTTKDECEAFVPTQLRDHFGILDIEGEELTRLTLQVVCQTRCAFIPLVIKGRLGRDVSALHGKDGADLVAWHVNDDDGEYCCLLNHHPRNTDAPDVIEGVLNNVLVQKKAAFAKFLPCPLGPIKTVYVSTDNAWYNAGATHSPEEPVFERLDLTSPDFEEFALGSNGYSAGHLAQMHWLEYWWLAEFKQRVKRDDAPWVFLQVCQMGHSRGIVVKMPTSMIAAVQGLEVAMRLDGYLEKGENCRGVPDDVRYVLETLLYALTKTAGKILAGQFDVHKAHPDVEHLLLFCLEAPPDSIYH